MQLVCPHDPSLFERLEGRTIVVKASGPEAIAAAAGDVRSRNRLALVVAPLATPLAETVIADNWRGIPIMLQAPSCGPLSDIIRLAPELRRLGIRIALPATAEALTGARVLASLGVAVAIDFGDTPDWDRLGDLMTYALLGLVPHAPIEPFATIAAGFQPDGLSEDWGRAEFDDPVHFIHLDADGNIALTPHDLAAGRFAGDLSDLYSADLHRAIARHADSWRDLFAADHFCARCQAFRVCRARLLHDKPEPDGCAAFCDEMMDVLARRTKRRPAA